MALIRVVSDSRSINSVYVTLLFVFTFFSRQRQVRGRRGVVLGGSSGNYAWRTKAERDAMRAYWFSPSKRSKLMQTFCFRRVHNSRSHSGSRHHTRSSLSSTSSENKVTRISLNLDGTWSTAARGTRHSYSIQQGGVCSGSLRSSYLLKNGTKVYLKQILARHHHSNRNALISIPSRAMKQTEERCRIIFDRISPSE
jgi:hypothetical protein